jgi:hypothetical protein
MLPAELRGDLPASGSYNLEQMYRFAQICQQSGLFEDVTDAAQAFIKIARGQELGIAPMASMSAFEIIRKRLFIKPAFIAAKINSCGYGRYKVIEQTTERCVIRFARKGAGLGWEDCPDVTYTYDEAKAHGLVDRSPHWKASPAHMLYQRCMGRGGAMYFPELLGGLQPPPDDAPVTVEQREQNVIELFGEGSDPTAYAAVRQTPPTAPPQEGPQEAAGATQASGGDNPPVHPHERHHGHSEGSRRQAYTVDPETGVLLDADGHMVEEEDEGPGLFGGDN